MISRWLTLLLWFGGSLAIAGDWPCFRGPSRDGKSDEPKTPLQWGKEQNIKWKAKLPRPGNSSPIVVGQKVFVSCAQDVKGHQRSLYCFDRATGKELWVKTIEYPGDEPTHGTNPHCGSTPASNGKVVVVWHGSAGLFCYDMDGQQLWKTDLGEFRHIWGYASSPVIHQDAVFLNCGPGARSFVVAVKLKDGKILWQVDEPLAADDKHPQTKGWIGSWSTPVVRTIDGVSQLMVFQARRVNGHDLATGKIIWTIEGNTDLAYTDPIVGDGTAVAMSGFGGKAIGFKPGGTGNVTDTRRLWLSDTKTPQRISSGIIIGEHMYMANEPGLIECLEVATGKQVWQQRTQGQTFWAAMVSTPGRLYATSQKGVTLVFEANPREWKLLATNDLASK